MAFFRLSSCFIALSLLLRLTVSLFCWSGLFILVRCRYFSFFFFLFVRLVGFAYSESPLLVPIQCLLFSCSSFFHCSARHLGCVDESECIVYMSLCFLATQFVFRSFSRPFLAASDTLAHNI